MEKNCGCTCTRLIEDKRYSIIFEDDQIVIRESDSERGGYILRKAGAVQSSSSGKNKANILLSFEEAD